MSDLSCTDVEGLLPLHVGGDLDREKTQAVDVHLHRCLPCFREFREYAAMRARLGVLADMPLPTGALDHFTDDGRGQPLELESGNLHGYQIKGGAVRNVTDEWSVFGNAGYVSKIPIFDGVIDDVNGVKLDDPRNEKFLSFEVGAQFRSMDRGVSWDVNIYNTEWRDRAFNLFVRNLTGEGGDGLVRLLGVDARHMGIESQFAWQPSDILRFDVAASIGN